MSDFRVLLDPELSQFAQSLNEWLDQTGQQTNRGRLDMLAMVASACMAELIATYGVSKEDAYKWVDALTDTAEELSDKTDPKLLS